MIGRGAARPSEIGARLQVPQTQLSKTFEALIDGGFLRRESPAGEKKRVHYIIQDAVLRFWFGVRQPHVTRWHAYSADQKMHVLRLFASGVFEQEWRGRYPGSKRHWEKGLEIDLLAPGVIAEVEFKSLTAGDRRRVEAELRSKWKRSSLAKSSKPPEFLILDYTAYTRTLKHERAKAHIG